MTPNRDDFDDFPAAPLDRERLAEAFRRLHTVKGEAHYLRRAPLVAAAHAAESVVYDALAALEAGAPLSGETTAVIHAAVLRVRALLPVSLPDAFIAPMVQDLAVTLGKRVELVHAGTDVRLHPHEAAIVRATLPHLIRNALAHGFEAPEERVAAGKSAVGTLALVLARDGSGALEVSLADDGRGMTEDVAAAAFLPGFSTAASVDVVSGRGIGLDAVRVTVTRAGGAVALDSEPGRGTRVTLVLPRAA